MKKYISIVALAFLLTIGAPQMSHAQVSDQGTISTMSASERADLIIKLRALLVQLIAQLQAQLASQSASSTPAVVVNVPVQDVPLFGGITSQTMTDLSLGNIATTTSVNKVDGKVVSSRIVGTVPLVVNATNYASGYAHISGTPSADGGSGLDGGFTWQNGYPVPAFEGLAPDTYSYSVKLFDRPYAQTNQGKDTSGVVAEIDGTFIIPAK